MATTTVDNPVAPSGPRPDKPGDAAYFAHVNPVVSRMLEPGHRRILDVGCGAAAMGHMWKTADPSLEIWGLELNPGAAAIAETRIDRVLQVDLDRLEELPADAGRFDLITCGDVLEHLRDPGRLLSVLARYLTPGGEFVTCVPNISHWSVLAQLLQARFDYQDEGLLDRTHIHFFTPTTFHELVAGVGLQAVTAIVPIMSPHPATGQVAHFGATLTGLPDRVAAIQRDMDTYQVVFRTRPPVTGPMTRFVTFAGGPPADTATVVSTFKAAFRAGEPVRLAVAGPSPEALAGISAQVVSGDDLTRPPVDFLVVDPASNLLAQLPPGPDRTVATGDPTPWPTVPACPADRLSLVAAARARQP